MTTAKSIIETIEYQDLDSHKFLLFKLNDELYATPLLSVKQVIERQNVKAVPNTADYFSGLINYRGQIMGLVDLKKRFQIEEKGNSKKTFLIFDSESGPIAAQVDHVESVVAIDDSQIEKNPNIKTHVPLHYMLGIAKYGDEMVTVIDLHKSFSSEDYVQINSKKLMSG